MDPDTLEMPLTPGEQEAGRRAPLSLVEWSSRDRASRINRGSRNLPRPNDSAGSWMSPAVLRPSSIAVITRNFLQSSHSFG